MSQTMRFTRVIEEGRRAYCQLWSEVLCYEPQCGVHVLHDSTGRHEPETPQLWLGELPDEGWQHDPPASTRSAPARRECAAAQLPRSRCSQGEARAESAGTGAAKGGRS